MAKDFLERLVDLGLEVNDELLEKLETYYQYLISENEVMNLTAITEKEEVYHKHFLDSLSLVKAVDPTAKTLLDVGSGAGFPSLPLKIFFPSLKVTIIEATLKKINFLERLIEKLGLKDVLLLNARVEEFQEREQYDIVTARAVAKLNILSEITLPFVKKGGCLIAMKSEDCLDELSEATNAIRVLGGETKDVIAYELSEGLSRSLIVILKKSRTPIIYPRPYPKIKNRPL